MEVVKFDAFIPGTNLRRLIDVCTFEGYEIL